MSTVGSPEPAEGAVRVSVPATSANLGPGFDSLGLALTLRDELSARLLPAGEVVVDVEGHGGDAVPRDASHLVVRALYAAWDAAVPGASRGTPHAQRPGVHLTCHNVIPHARGLGSSSAAIVAGVELGRALAETVGGRLDAAAALSLCADLEGHPDNVAPAFLGGLVVAGHDEPGDSSDLAGGGWWTVPAPVHPDIRAVAFVPPTPLETAVARGLLPATVPHAEAAADAGRAALLVTAFASRPDQLLRGTRDYLHQDYRRPAMPASLALVDVLRADGIAAVVSGAGPTVLALHAGGPDAERDLLRRVPDGWAVHALGIDPRGVVRL